MIPAACRQAKNSSAVADEAAAEADDPVVEAFLAFLAADIERHPERIEAVSPNTVERIVELANAPSFSLVVTLGVEMVMCAQRDRTFRATVNGAALSVCDTIGLLLASRVRHGPLRKRVGLRLLGRAPATVGQ